MSKYNIRQALVFIIISSTIPRRTTTHGCADICQTFYHNDTASISYNTDYDRTHLEYAIPACTNISDKDLEKLENVQFQCLRRVICAKTHSSSCAVEVICGTVPVRFRKRELCCRECIRIQTKENGNGLLQLMETTIRSWLRFCPLEYIKVVSRELVRALD